jgi:two-component system sensor histidine kinase GlrK
MHLLQPDSFPKLLVISFAMVLLPLIIALINNAISIDQFANRSQHTVHQAVQSTQSSRCLAQLLVAMECNARQVVTLCSCKPLKAHGANRDSFPQATAEFGALPLNKEQRVALTAIVAAEAG